MTGYDSKSTRQKTTINKNTKILKEPWLCLSDIWHLWNNLHHRVNKTTLQQVATNYWIVLIEVTLKRIKRGLRKKEKDKEK